MTIIKIRHVVCSTCRTVLRRGSYLRCTLGCNAPLCRQSKRGCVTAHTDQCPAMREHRRLTEAP